MKYFLVVTLIIGSLIMFGISKSHGDSHVDWQNFPDPKVDLQVDPKAGPQTMVVAGGCFWCTQGVYENTPGATKVISGYAGGTADTADYETVSSGTTNHAEAVEVTYDPSKTTYGKLLKAFFSIAHDPTQLNRQGNDTGRQYRSAIFYANEDQKRVAAAYIKQLDDAKVFDSPIVTTLEPLTGFYPAEKYHQDYAKLHPEQPYIAYHAMPLIEKAKEAAAAESATQPAEK
jgi:peptide-methionine (S)-S-oxide reductase